MTPSKQARRAANPFPGLMLRATGAMGAVGALLWTYASEIERHWIDVVRITLKLPHLPREFEGYRIVLLSDLHAGKWLPNGQLHRIVHMANSFKPDLVAITGDFVTYTYHEAPFDLVPALSGLDAPDGVTAILGNHDYWGSHGPALIRHVIKDAGMIDLNNTVHTVRRGKAALHIAGVDSARERMDRIDLVLETLPTEGCAILLSHEPDTADAHAATGRFDLQLSGHSHGGQVRIPFVKRPPNLPPMGRKYHTGLYQVGSMLQYTNRGLGVVGLPLRFCCRPEITVITLERGSS